MADLRLGDVIDDWCVKCRRLTNHSIVSIVDAAVAKVRCRTCYHDHDYRHEEPPPSKKDQKKQALFNEVLSTINPDTAAGSDDGSRSEADAPSPEPPTSKKKTSKKARGA